MKNFKLCYPILEKNLGKFEKIVSSLRKEKGVMLELRLDSLISKGVGIDEIYRDLSNIKSISGNKRIILTIRTKKEGGEVSLTHKLYKKYISLLITSKVADYIDIEYNMYKKDKSFYDNLIKTFQKKVILSTHIFDKVYSEKKYKKLFDETLRVKCDIVKFAVMTKDIKDVVSFMQASRENAKRLARYKKSCIFIAMGTFGQISRLYPEYTDSKIVFMAPNGKKASNLGQFDKKTYYKYRKILEKKLKNC